MLKAVGARGQLTLGKKYSGRYFELEERANGELVLRPAKMVRDKAQSKSNILPAFEIAEVKQVSLSSREDRNARG